MRLSAWLPILFALMGSAETRVQSGWTETLGFPEDPYAVASQNHTLGWAKFMILADDPGTVYFQNSNLYPFHYDFATNELAPFLGKASCAWRITNSEYKMAFPRKILSNSNASP